MLSGQLDRNFPPLARIAHIDFMVRQYLGSRIAGPDEPRCFLFHIREELGHKIGVECRETHKDGTVCLKAKGRSEKADGGPNPGPLRDEAPRDTKFFAEPRRVKRGRAAEGDHRIFAEVFAILDRMNAGGVGHVFINHLGQAPGGLAGIHVELLTDRRLKRLGGVLRMERNRAAREIVGIKLAKHKICVGNSGLSAAPTITGGARLGPCAFWADADLVHRVDMSDRSTACANLNHIDHRDRNWHAGALFEAICAGHFEDARGFRRLVFDQANLRRSAAHIKAQHLVELVFRSDIGGENRAASRAGFDQTHRKLCGALQGHNSTTRMHQEHRASRAFCS